MIVANLPFTGRTFVAVKSLQGDPTARDEDGQGEPPSFS